MAIAAGDRHSLALKADGTLVRWGYQGSSLWGSILTNVPADLTNVLAMAGGYAFNVALSVDGTVRAWGSNNSDQTNVPPNLTNVFAVSAGGFHATAMTRDGRLVTWGNYAGSGTPYIPPGLYSVIAIKDGWESTMALMENGTVVAWGFNSWGQTNVPVGLTSVVAIAAGAYHNFALIGEGQVRSGDSLVNPTWSNGAFSVKVRSQRAHVYRLEYKDSLFENNWTSHPFLAGNGSMLKFTDSSATNSLRFYRIQEWWRPSSQLYLPLQNFAQERRVCFAFAQFPSLAVEEIQCGGVA